MKSPKNSNLIGNWVLTPWIFFVGVTNGVPTVQNIKKQIQNIGLIANWAKEDQDQDVRDALRNN